MVENQISPQIWYFVSAVSEKESCHVTWLYDTIAPIHEWVVLFLSEMSFFKHAMCSDSVGLDILGFFWTFIYFYIAGVKIEGSGEIARMCRLAWAFAVPLLRDTSSPFSYGLAYEPITRA